MKLATFTVDHGEERVGVVDVEAGTVTDVQIIHCRETGAPSPDLTNMLAVIESASPARRRIESLLAAAEESDRHSLRDVQLLAPLPRPTQLRDFLMFEQHLLNCLVQESALTGCAQKTITPAWYEIPSYYRANTATVIGSNADIRWPDYTEQLDFELEIGCVIGRLGRDIPASGADDYIYGYTIFNDVSARDIQLRTAAIGMGPGKGKDFDTGNVLGPWLVTADEIGDPYDLTMTARVNGEVWGGGNSGGMQFTWDRVLEFVSQSETIYPGEIFGSGTVGTGCGLEQGRFLCPGDVIELEIEKIGVLRNRIVR